VDFRPNIQYSLRLVSFTQRVKQFQNQSLHPYNPTVYT